MRIPQRKLIKLITVCLLMTLMSSCKQADILEINNCTAFGLIYPSRADTTETKRQVLTHNQIYERVCLNKE